MDRITKKNSKHKSKYDKFMIDFIDLQIIKIENIAKNITALNKYYSSDYLLTVMCNKTLKG